jgi:hypothetical protein
MTFLDPLIGAMAYGAEITRLGTMAYGAEGAGDYIRADS